MKNIIPVINTMSSPVERIRFLNATLPLVGNGSSRRCYELPDSSVLKIAKNEKGIAQNDGETSFDEGSDYELLNTPSDFCEHGTWLVCEKLEKATRKKFKEITGLDFNELSADLSELSTYQVATSQRGGYFSKEGEILDKFAASGNPVLERLVNFINDTGCLAGDFGKLNSWGIDGNGNIKAMDYGLTADDFLKHYVKNKEAFNGLER